YTAAIDYSLPLAAELGEVVLSTRYFRISDIHYGGNIYAWDYEKVDARVDWLGMFGSSFDAALFVTNAFDTEAIVAPSSSSAALGVNAAIFNERRRVGASLRYSFSVQPATPDQALRGLVFFGLIPRVSMPPQWVPVRPCWPGSYRQGAVMTIPSADPGGLPLSGLSALP